MSRSFQRSAPQRQTGTKIIIACEGSSTEPGYFGGLRETKNLSDKRVIIPPHVGTDPLTVVNSAIDARDGQKRGNGWGKKDEAWAVFDGDEHKQRDPENWNNAIQKAAGRSIHLAISNPCFEFWYLLHFREHNANLTRQKARELLKHHVPDYEKADRLYPHPLGPLTMEAIQRAKQIAARAEGDGLPLHTNPGTNVWGLVETLLSLESQVR